jgi:hypothetical protein
VKHLKPYKIFESNISDESNTEIMEVLSHVADHGYDIKIYDFYYHHQNKDDINTEVHQLSMSISSGLVTEGSKKAKIVKISNRENRSDWFSVDDFAKMGFSSSRFIFNGNFSKYREFFLDLMDSVSQFSDRNPKICFKDTDNILILLEYEDVTKEDLELKKTIGELYHKLYLTLKLTDIRYSNHAKYDVTYYPQESHLKISPKGEDGQIYAYKIISTLCNQLKDTEGYGWMNREEYRPIENRDFKNIKDLLDDSGLEVTFSTESVSGNFNDNIKFIISKKK